VLEVIPQPAACFTLLKRASLPPFVAHLDTSLGSTQLMMLAASPARKSDR